MVEAECKRQLKFSGLPAEALQDIESREVMFGEHPVSLAELPLITFRAAGGSEIQDAAPAGAAMEFLLAAADVLDDIQDDTPPVGAPEDEDERDQWIRETEILTSLLLLGEQSALSIFNSSLKQRRVALAVSLFNRFKLKAFSGQYLDAHTTIDSSSRPEMSLEITAGKSGSLGRCAGEFGATLVTDSPEIIEKAGRFGEYLAIARQFHDDVANLWPSSGKLDDLTLQKNTLPLTFSMAIGDLANGYDESALQNLIEREFERYAPADENVLTARDEVFTLGGAHFAMLQAIVHMVKAKTIAQEFEKLSPGCGMLRLLESD